MKFLQLTEQWCEVKKQIVKYTTYCTYRMMITKHLLPKFGDLELSQIDENIVQEYVLEQINDGGQSKKYTWCTVATLKAILKYGAKKGLCREVDWDIRYPTQGDHKKLQVLSLRNQRKLLSHIMENMGPKNIGILIALCTGMRIGEVCGLEWDDVDLTQRIISVKRTASRIYDVDKKSTKAVINTPKTRNSYREIPISKPLYEALREVKRVSPYNYVVGGKDRAVDPRGYREYFQRLLRRLNIPKIGFHGLRHTFATRLIESKCDYKTASAILGHSNVSTTLNLYVHPDVKQKKSAINKVSRLIGFDTLGEEDEAPQFPSKEEVVIAGAKEGITEQEIRKIANRKIAYKGRTRDNYPTTYLFLKVLYETIGVTPTAEQIAEELMTYE